MANVDVTTHSHYYCMAHTKLLFNITHHLKNLTFLYDLMSHTKFQFHSTSNFGNNNNNFNMAAILTDVFGRLSGVKKPPFKINAMSAILIVVNRRLLSVVCQTVSEALLQDQTASMSSLIWVRTVCFYTFVRL